MNKKPHNVHIVALTAENGMDKLFPPPWAESGQEEYWKKLRVIIEHEHDTFVPPDKKNKEELRLEAGRHLFRAVMCAMPTGDAEVVGMTMNMLLATVNTLLRIKKGRADEDDGTGENSWTGRKR